MYAVIKTGGKQYKVAKDELLEIEKLAAEPGARVQFNEVLMVGSGAAVAYGRPFLADAGVQAEVLDQVKADKVVTFHMRRRKHSSKRTRGHRQHLTVVRITDILTSGASASGIAAAVGARSTDAFVVADPALAADIAAEKAARAGGAAVAASAVQAPAVEGMRPANLLSEARGEADDLTRISGVGPKLNALLNENGVFHFWQIAEWGPAEVAFMDEQLSFKGRIDRENWIEQAQAFVAEAGGAA